jgi:hypothetical protein
MIIRIYIGLKWLSLSFMLALVGCSSELEEATPEKLMSRAETYWNAIQANDLHTLYQMDSRYAEGKLLPHQAVRLTPSTVRVLRYELNNPQVNDGKGTVQVKTYISFPGIIGKEIGGTNRTEQWVWIKKDWYRVEEDVAKNNQKE